MTRLAPILLVLTVLLFTATESLALPPCPEDLNERYHNCYGTYVADDGQKYVGEWRDNKQHGQGTLTFDASHEAAGEKYVGEWKDDKQHGQGTFSWPDGGKYVGEWRDGKRNGQGTFTFGSSSEWAGDKYVGEYKDDLLHGQGTYTWADGNKYVGEYRDGIKQGQGTFTWADGRKYVGGWRDGKENGKGTVSWPDGDNYVGEWRDGKMNGQGTYTWVNGGKYVGEWRDGKENGKGTFSWPDGDKYVGGWRDGKKHGHGQGTFTWTDGRKYVGEFKDGLSHGYGTEYTADGTVKKQGYWENDRLVRSTKGADVEKKKPGLVVVPSIEFGDYHALVIGNNDYAHLPKLKNAVQDAKDVSSVLEHMYGFEVTTLLNASRAEIFSALVKFRSELTWGNNLIIYYAGHGIIDEITELGSWQPIDAAEEDPTNWISNSDITNQLKAITAKHVMVIADACYSGTLAYRSAGKGLRTAREREVWLKRISQKRSRTAMVSGGYEPVMDGGGGKNSIFAKALLDVLTENQSVMYGREVFDKLKMQVALGSEQTPEYARIKNALHDGAGDFVLVRRDATAVSPSVSEGADPLERIENKCAEWGFTKGTEKYGDCIMKLYQR